MSFLTQSLEECISYLDALGTKLWHHACDWICFELQQWLTDTPSWISYILYMSFYYTSTHCLFQIIYAREVVFATQAQKASAKHFNVHCEYIFKKKVCIPPIFFMKPRRLHNIQRYLVFLLFGFSLVSCGQYKYVDLIFELSTIFA